jgi:hypothetical protein
MQASGTLIYRSTETEIAIAQPFNIDYLFRIGVRLPEGANGVTLYGELQHLTDDWLSTAPIPKLLISYGLLLSIERLE